MKDIRAAVRSAIAQAGITEDRFRVGRHSAASSGAPHGHLASKLAEAIGLALIQGTSETDVSDLARSDRIWYATLCVQSGALLGATDSYADFIKKFSDLLESIISNRGPAETGTVAA